MKLFCTVLLALGTLGAGAELWGERVVLRVGYFPNVTHAQGVIGGQLTSEGRGWFEERLGKDVEVQWFPFNAGPSAMEAIFARSIDLTYVGPNPALNAFIRSRGEEIRVLAGSCEGGAALVVRKDSGIETAKDFKGRAIATPQFGNTQDVAARVWLKGQGFKVTLMGGDAKVLPTSNPDLLMLFGTGKIDAAWTVEPWVSRLEKESGGRIFLEQRDALVTILVSSVRLLKERRELVEKFRAAHVELTEWVLKNEAEAKKLVRAGLSREARREIPAEWVENAWGRLRFTPVVGQEQFDVIVKEAQSVGFLKDAIPLGRMMEEIKK